MNVVGFIPLPFSGERVDILGVDVPKLQIYAASANLSVALTLTLVTFVATHFEGIRYNGVVPYFKSWIPAGLPPVRPWRLGSVGAELGLPDGNMGPRGGSARSAANRASSNRDHHRSLDDDPCAGGVFLRDASS